MVIWIFFKLRFIKRPDVMSVESMIVLLTHVIFQKLSGHLNVFSKFELEWNPIEHHKGLNYHKAAQPFYFKLNLTIFRIFEGLSSVCNLLLINVNLKISNSKLVAIILQEAKLSTFQTTMYNNVWYTVASNWRFHAWRWGERLSQRAPHSIKVIAH